MFWANFLDSLTRKKISSNDVEEERCGDGDHEQNLTGGEGGQERKLARVLGLTDLTLLGIGSTLGLGVYVLAGSVAKELAGPSVVLSFVVAAVASAFSGLCYAEFAAKMARTGSAYSYTYASIGEFAAFIIGWNLVLEYIIGTASEAKAISNQIDALLNNAYKTSMERAFPYFHGTFISTYPDFIAAGIVLTMSGLLSWGVKESTLFNNVLTALNLLSVASIVTVGVFKVNINNWFIKKEDIPSSVTRPGKGGFMPFGIPGVIMGAAKCFFGFVGFDCVATTGEESRNPKRNIPIAIFLSLFVVFICYVAVSLVVTMVIPYYDQDVDAPFPHIFDVLRWPLMKWAISLGSLFALLTAMFGALFPLPRILYAMSTDGLLYSCFSYVSPRTKTPLVSTLVTGVLTSILSAIFKLDQLVDMLSIGTLLAYTIMAASVLVLRYEKDEEGQRKDNQSVSNGKRVKDANVELNMYALQTEFLEEIDVGQIENENGKGAMSRVPVEKCDKSSRMGDARQRKVSYSKWEAKTNRTIDMMIGEPSPEYETLNEIERFKGKDRADSSEKVSEDNGCVSENLGEIRMKKRNDEHVGMDEMLNVQNSGELLQNGEDKEEINRVANVSPSGRVVVGHMSQNGGRVIGEDVYGVHSGNDDLHHTLYELKKGSSVIFEIDDGVDEKEDVPVDESNDDTTYQQKGRRLIIYDEDWLRKPAENDEHHDDHEVELKHSSKSNSVEEANVDENDEKEGQETRILDDAFSDVSQNEMENHTLKEENESLDNNKVDEKTKSSAIVLLAPYGQTRGNNDFDTHDDSDGGTIERIGESKKRSRKSVKDIVKEMEVSTNFQTDFNLNRYGRYSVYLYDETLHQYDYERVQNRIIQANSKYFYENRLNNEFLNEIYKSAKDIVSRIENYIQKNQVNGFDLDGGGENILRLDKFMSESKPSAQEQQQNEQGLENDEKKLGTNEEESGENIIRDKLNKKQLENETDHVLNMEQQNENKQEFNDKLEQLEKDEDEIDKESIEMKNIEQGTEYVLDERNNENEGVDEHVCIENKDGLNDGLQECKDNTETRTINEEMVLTNELIDESKMIESCFQFETHEEKGKGQIDRNSEKASDEIVKDVSVDNINEHGVPSFIDGLSVNNSLTYSLDEFVRLEDSFEPDILNEDNHIEEKVEIHHRENDVNEENETVMVSNNLFVSNTKEVEQMVEILDKIEVLSKENLNEKANEIVQIDEQCIENVCENNEKSVVQIEKCTDKESVQGLENQKASVLESDCANVTSMADDNLDDTKTTNNELEMKSIVISKPRRKISFIKLSSEGPDEVLLEPSGVNEEDDEDDLNRIRKLIHANDSLDEKVNESNIKKPFRKISKIFQHMIDTNGISEAQEIVKEQQNKGNSLDKELDTTRESLGNNIVELNKDAGNLNENKIEKIKEEGHIVKDKATSKNIDEISKKDENVQNNSDKSSAAIERTLQIVNESITINEYNHAVSNILVCETIKTPSNSRSFSMRIRSSVNELFNSDGKDISSNMSETISKWCICVLIILTCIICLIVNAEMNLNLMEPAMRDSLVTNNKQWLYNFNSNTSSKEFRNHTIDYTSFEHQNGDIERKKSNDENNFLFSNQDKINETWNQIVNGYGILIYKQETRMLDDAFSEVSQNEMENHTLKEENESLDNNKVVQNDSKNQGNADSELPSESFDLRNAQILNQSVKKVTTLHETLYTSLKHLNTHYGMTAEFDQHVLLNIKYVAYVVIGLLYAVVFVVLCRQAQSKTVLKFKVPYVPLVPCVSIFMNIYLMINLDVSTWVRFVIWLTIGMLIYLTYSLSHSKQKRKK